MRDEWKPTGYTSVSPYLITENAQAVIDFLEATFAASVVRRFDHPDGSIMHAEVRIDDTVVMLGQAGENWPAAPSHLHVYVPEVDTVYAAALDGGGQPVEAPVKKGDADRRGGVKDPGGNTWWIATQTRA
jgi:PhnB protein